VVNLKWIYGDQPFKRSTSKNGGHFQSRASWSPSGNRPEAQKARFPMSLSHTHIYELGFRGSPQLSLNWLSLSEKGSHWEWHRRTHGPLRRRQTQGSYYGGGHMCSLYRQRRTDSWRVEPSLSNGGSVPSSRIHCGGRICALSRRRRGGAMAAPASATPPPPPPDQAVAPFLSQRRSHVRTPSGRRGRIQRREAAAAPVNARAAGGSTRRQIPMAHAGWIQYPVTGLAGLFLIHKINYSVVGKAVLTT
jgi:hypothetical protein